MMHKHACMRTGAEGPPTGEDAEAGAPAAKRRKGRKGKKVAAKGPEPASSPGARSRLDKVLSVR